MCKHEEEKRSVTPIISSPPGTLVRGNQTTAAAGVPNRADEQVSEVERSDTPHTIDRSLALFLPGTRLCKVRYSFQAFSWAPWKKRHSHPEDR